MNTLTAELDSEIQLVLILLVFVISALSELRWAQR